MTDTPKMTYNEYLLHRQIALLTPALDEANIALIGCIQALREWQKETGYQTDGPAVVIAEKALSSIKRARE